MSRSFLVLLLAVTALGAAELRLAHIFQDHMVLQREIAAPVWGGAEAGATVTVSFAGQTAETTADEAGYWIARLAGLEASAEGQVLAISSGGQSIERSGVLVGEVWFCAGQSNMARGVGIEMKGMPLTAARLGNPDLPLVRYVRYGSLPSREPLADRPDGRSGSWQAMDAQSFLKSMAIPFFFGRHLHEALGVPVGLVQVAVSGTTQTAWTPRAVLDQMHAEGVCTIDYAGWLARSKSKGEGKPDKNEPCVLHNGQIHPLVPYGMRGLIWHQGEGGPNEQHAERMVALVEHWRELFGHQFTYIWAALSRNTTSPPPLAPITGNFYRHVRNRQFLKAQQLFGYAGDALFVDCYDLGNTDTHWCEKDKAGVRMAKAALDGVYGQESVFTGPQMLAAEVSEGTATVTFTQVGSGLVYKPSIDGISGFVLSTGDAAAWIEPRVEGTDTLVFEHPALGKNALVFYAYHANPHETLFNQEGYPASTFAFGSGRDARGDDPLPLLTLVEKAAPTARLSVLHVRRNVVVVAVVGRKISGTSTVRFLVPQDWTGVSMELDGEAQPVGEITTDENGRRSVELRLEARRWSYMIFNSGKEAEARAEVDLTRS